jgi:hypothetical protein
VQAINNLHSEKKEQKFKQMEKAVAKINKEK